MSDEEEVGGASTTTAPTPPPPAKPQPNPPPPNPPQKNVRKNGSPSSPARRAMTRRSPVTKSQPPPPPPTTTTARPTKAVSAHPPPPEQDRHAQGCREEGRPSPGSGHSATLISATRAGLAAHNLWNTMHRRQVCIWFDNLRRYRSGADPSSPDLTLNCTVVAVLHTTALPAYPGLPELVEIEVRVPKVAGDIFCSHIALFDRIDVANQGIQRVWFRAPLDIAKKMFVLSTGDPFSCLSSAPAHTKSFCNLWLICHVWNTARGTMFRCL